MIIEETQGKIKDFDYGYMNKTTDELLKVVENLGFKGYEKHFNKNPNQDYNHLQNFFIWKKKDKKEFIRVCLILNGFHEKKVFYWAVDFNFKPFNKKKCDKWESEIFKGTARDLYLSRFEEAVLKIKEFLKGGIK